MGTSPSSIQLELFNTRRSTHNRSLSPSQLHEVRRCPCHLPPRPYLGLGNTINNGAVVGSSSSSSVVGSAISTSAVTDITKTTTITKTASAGLNFAQPTVMVTLVPTVVPTMLPTVTPVAYIDYDYEDTSAASGLAPFAFF